MIAAAATLLRHVAIIDDDLRLGRMLERQLVRYGHQATLLAEPERYVEELTALAPEFLLLDLNLGRHDGFEILHELARIGCRIQIILMSGAEPRLLAVAWEMGTRLGLRMAGPLTKPFPPDQLNAQLAAIADDDAIAQDTDGIQSGALSAQDVLTGLDRHEFVLHYQPEIELDTRRLVGMEALLRWHHPVLGLLAPEHFAHLIMLPPVAEPVTAFVLETAIADLASFGGEHTGLLSVSVNIPAVLVEQESLVQQITGLLLAHRIQPERLIVELIETGSLEISAAMQKTLCQLRLRGIQVAMDDFGSGLSSLKRLATLPFTILKLDRDFILHLDRQRGNQFIVEEMLRLARKMQLKVIAEGIEDGATCEMLTAMGCELGQGYLLGRPMAVEDFALWTVQRGMTQWPPSM